MQLFEMLLLSLVYSTL